MSPTPDRIGVRRHPPERGRRAPVVVLGCGCTCCCCCCLHTLGGVIGAAIGSSAGRLPPLELYDEPAPPRPTGIKPGATDMTAGRARPAVRAEIDEDAFDVRRPSSLSAAALFWYLCLGLSALGLLLGAGGRGEGLLLGVIVLLLAFPAVQLVSAAVVFLVLLFTGRSDRSFQMRRLGKITLGVVIGSVAGLGVMWLLYRAWR